MREKHRFCPFDGRQIHVYLEVNEDPFYMENVQGSVEFRVVPVCERPVKILSFKASVDDKELRKGVKRLGTQRTWRPGFEPFSIERLLRSSQPGRNVIEIRLVYEVDGIRYTMEGAYGIVALERKPDRQTFIATIDNSISQSGDGIISQAKYKNRDLDFTGWGGENKAIELIEELKKDRGDAYVPVEMSLAEESTLRPRPPRVPDWSPMRQVRLHFAHGGVEHNYCLLADTRVDFGRASNMMVRLYDVERSWAELERQAKQGIPLEKRRTMSPVSGAQWRVEATGNGVNVSQLSSRENAFRAKGALMKPGIAYRLKHHGSVCVKNSDGIPVVGLEYAAHADLFDGVAKLFASAREILSHMKSPPTPERDWEGKFGGYRLARQFSLTGQSLEGIGKAQALEAYVFLPGWITIGSAPEACVVVPVAGVLPVHARILRVSDYYFIVPADETAFVQVGDKRISPCAPWPLKPGDAIRVGPATLTFDGFSQCFV